MKPIATVVRLSPYLLAASLVSAVTFGAAVGCKKKDAEPVGGSAPGGAKTDPAPATRPSQSPQPKLPALQLPDDAKRADKIALGHSLFFDTRMSVDGSRACYSCHQNEDGTGGHDPIAIGAADKKLTRHAPAMWNVAYFKNVFYDDGRSPTLEAQAIAAWGGGNLGVGTESEKLAAKATELAKIPGYAKLFEAAFPGAPITPELFAQALSEYERTLLCSDTAYDKFAAGDKTALSEQQQRGLDVFEGKGQCVTCHSPPMFSTAMGVDGGFFANVGIGTYGVAEADVDIGRMKVTKAATDWAAFKPPTLRNIGKTAPYFHNGSVTSLDEAVTVMSTGGINNKNKSTLLADRNLSKAEHDDLVAFLHGLDCPGKLEQPTLPQ